MADLMTPARRVNLTVTIDGVDATGWFAPSLLSFEYVDQAAGKSDEVSLELCDPDDFWLNGAMPKKGSVITAQIHCRDWHGPGQDLFLVCGRFTCDAPASYSGPPGQLSVKALTAELTSELRETKRTKAWEEYTLQGVAAELAGKHGLELFYDAPTHQFKRQDQKRESDLAFLQRLCVARGVNLKIHDGKMVLYGGQKADAAAPTMTINRRAGNFLTAAEFSFNVSSEGTGYDKAEAEYHEPSTRQVQKAQAVADPDKDFSGGKGKVLTTEERTESPAEAETIAKGRLREANKKERTGSFTVMGHPGLVAGQTVMLEDFGIFSGTYFVEKVTHRLGGQKYTTTADIRRPLNY